jgi:hypothetical protein
MTTATPNAAAALTQALATLLDLSRKARFARSEAELGFLLVNETSKLLPYRQAALWYAGGGIRSLSGLLQPELNSPYCQWLSASSRHLARTASDISNARPLTRADLPEQLAEQWADWWPAHALWLPLSAEPIASAPSDASAAPQAAKAANPKATPSAPAALILARDQPFAPAECELLREWGSAWFHALIALRSRRRRGLLSPWRRDTAGALGAQRPAWRRPLPILVLLVAFASILPVHLSVLAPGELVPSQPILVRAPLDGVIDSFHVQPNQPVNKGDALFGFDEALIKSRLDVAQQALATASTEYRQTMQQAVSDPRARSQLALLNGRIEERRAELTYLTEQLERARVVAPQSGVALFDDPLEWIGKPVVIGERILRIAADGDLEIEAWLPIGDAIPLAKDAPAALYLNAQPLNPLQARLRYMAHEAVQRPDGTYAYRIRASLESATDQRVGLKGTVKLQGERVPLAYWLLRRPIASLRITLGI